MNKKFTRNDDEDGEDSPNQKKVQYYKRTIPSFGMIVNLNDSIRDPGHYFDLVEEMESLTENDIEDLEKAKHSIELLIELIKNESN